MASLEGPRAKVCRAEHHLDALNGEIVQLPKTHGDSVRAELDEANQTLIGYLEKPMEYPQIRWGLMLGDFVSNLRAALDHLVCQLVALNNGKVHSRHQFPIVNSDPEFEGLTKKPPKATNKWRGQLDSLDATQVAMIQAVQPYKPTMGMPSLATLNRFSNEAKHRLIHSSNSTTDAVPEVHVSVDGRVIPLRAATWVVPPYSPVGPDTKLVEARPDPRFIPHRPNRQVHVHVDLSLTVQFGEVGNEDTRILDFRTCLNDVRKIIDAFSGYFPDDPVPGPEPLRPGA